MPRAGVRRSRDCWGEGGDVEGGVAMGSLL